MSTVRAAKYTNLSGAALTFADSRCLITSGEDFSLKYVERTIIGNDVGDTEGKTQHANGAIMFRLNQPIKHVISFNITRVNGPFLRVMTNAVINHTNIAQPMDIEYYFDNDAVTNEGSAASTVYLRDLTGADGLRIVAGDVIGFTVLVGSKKVPATAA